MLGEFTLQDCPYTLFEAIQSGLFFIGFDEWDEEDRPPKRIWNDHEQLNSHIEYIKRKRKSGSDGDEDAGPVTERNPLIDDLVRG